MLAGCISRYASWLLELSIPMSGDSFCKSGVVSAVGFRFIRFQSPCLGTLFASRSCLGVRLVWLTWLSIPMSGDSFCKLHRIPRLLRRLYRLSIPMSGDSFCKSGLPVAGYGGVYYLSIPMSGDSFCKYIPKGRIVHAVGNTFNPHVWGLFLQGVRSSSKPYISLILSIPMSGDSFCKESLAPNEVEERPELSIPMSGDSFCKLCFGCFFVLQV